MAVVSPARPARSNGSEPEYVTDWRVIYAMSVVVVLMVLGGVAWWVLGAAVLPRGVAAVNSGAGNAGARARESQALSTVRHTATEVVVPWAPLPPERPFLPSSEESESAESASDTTKAEDATEVAPDKASNDRIEQPEPDLFAELARVPILDFNAEPIPAMESTPQPTGSKRRRRPVAAPRILPDLSRRDQFALLANQADLVGLPLLDESECRQSAAEVDELSRLSRALVLRTRVSRPRIETSLSDELQVQAELARILFDRTRHQANSVAPLVQILQVQNFVVRLDLVDVLSSIEGPNASRALADRALFDMSEEIRAAAIQYLRARDCDDFRATLVAAFRYPWAPVARHAAETLIAVRDTGALPELETLLDQPDPTAPFLAADGNWHKKELVRVNHLRNCLLCHPGSASARDPLRASIPTPGRALSPGYRGSSASGAIRADVTYLRQDFSVMQPVADHQPWPELQRFDFFVRTRPLMEYEDQQLSANSETDAAEYPQRKAVRVALRELRKLSP